MVNGTAYYENYTLYSRIVHRRISIQNYKFLEMVVVTGLFDLKQLTESKMQQLVLQLNCLKIAY